MTMTSSVSDLAVTMMTGRRECATERWRVWEGPLNSYRRVTAGQDLLSEPRPALREVPCRLSLLPTVCFVRLAPAEHDNALPLTWSARASRKQGLGQVMREPRDSSSAVITSKTA
jgi:hypothetical protein